MMSMRSASPSRSMMPPPLYYVHAHRMDLVDIGRWRCTCPARSAISPDRRDVAVHGMNAFEYDQLGALALAAEAGFQMADVIMAEDALFQRPGGAALDIEAWLARPAGSTVGQRAVRWWRSPPRWRRIQRGEDQPGFLAVQVGGFPFSSTSGLLVAGNVAGAAGAEYLTGSVWKARPRPDVITQIIGSSTRP